MIRIVHFTQVILSVVLLWECVRAQMLGSWQSGSGGRHIRARQNGNDGNNNNEQPDTSAFNIQNGRIFTPGLGILLAVRILYN
jgi:hypothetical protein